MAGDKVVTYGLIGAKLGHSFSKTIHETLCSYKYELRELPTLTDFDAFMCAREFKAINVTLPYKERVIAYCAALSPLAQSIGAVNTIINQNGILYGDNTDFYGFKILSEGVTDFANKNVMILGTGGTCKTACAVAKELNAARITTVSRSTAKGSITYAEALLQKDTDIIINTSPVGMYPDNFSTPIDITAFPSLCGVIDVVYNPLQTQLVSKARSMGIPAANGMLMLVAQAKKAAELFCNNTISDAQIHKVFTNILSQSFNIILVGMPSCGKSSIGKALAMLTGRAFIDTDNMCEELSGSNICDIFASQGEPAFRQIETEVIKSVCRKPGQIIATGGGCVLFPENVEAMRQNGIIIYITRPFNQFETGGLRPLSTSKEALQNMLRVREPIYNKISDIVISNTSTVEHASKCAKEKYDEIINNKRA